MKLLGLCGSTRRQSTNKVLLEAFGAAAPEGVDWHLYDGVGGLPIFNPEDEARGLAPAVAAFIDEMRAADGVVISAPEYAHGIPGGLKNALDWLVSDVYVPDKPVMLVHASVRSLHSRVHLREVLKTMSLNLFPGPEFEHHLIGLTRAEAVAALDDSEIGAAMTALLSQFKEFVAQSAGPTMVGEKPALG